MVVGWYHSHPGFGCWLSSVDINTQQVRFSLPPTHSPILPFPSLPLSNLPPFPFSPQSFEQLNPRAVAVVVDPIQSVKGKVVIDAFRLINPSSVMMSQEPRQTTSNVGHLSKPSIQSLIHGLNRHYYSISIGYRKTELEQTMLGNLHKKNWTEGLRLRDWGAHKEGNEKAVKVSRIVAFLTDFWTKSSRPSKRDLLLLILRRKVVVLLENLQKNVSRTLTSNFFPFFLPLSLFLPTANASSLSSIHKVSSGRIHFNSRTIKD